MYSKEQINSIKKRVDLVSLIGNYVRLKKNGNNYLGLCPFHSEKTPSFSVNPTKGFYHCFGCGKSGDALKFLTDHSNYTFLEALEELGVQQGIRLKKNKQNFQPIRKILEMGNDFFLKNAQNLPLEAREYLKKRNFLSETLEKFELGYALAEWDAFKKQISSDFIGEAEEVGLIKKSSKYNKYYDFFRARIMFPFRNAQGDLVGFAGRSLNDDNSPKYLNSPEFELFQKSAFFYGMFQAKEAISKKNRIIIVEGYTDVLRMSEKGFAETVAIAGTAITPKHITQLKHKQKEAIFLFDGDSAGNKAACKSASISLIHGLEAKIVILPDGEDPDSFFEKHSEIEMENLLIKGKKIFSYIVENKKKNYEKTEDITKKKELLQELVDIGNSIGDFIKREIFFTEISKEFQIDLRKQQKKITNALQNEQKNYQKRIFFEGTEGNLLKAAIKNFKHLKLIKEYLQPEDFLSLVAQQFFQRMFALSEEDLQNISTVDLLGMYDEDKKIKDFIAADEDLKEPLFDETVRSWIYKLKYELIFDDYKKKCENKFSKRQQELINKRDAELKKIEHLKNSETKKIFTKHK